MSFNIYPIPPFYDPLKVKEIWRVLYEKRALDALEWANKYEIKPAYQDKIKINLIIIDVQNTFCIPGGELFVGGRSGLGAVEDNQRLCSFIYSNLGNISQITLTLNTHQTIQIFHEIFLINDKGLHPLANTLITSEDITSGKWKFNPEIGASIGLNAKQGQEYLEFYVNELKKKGKYDLTIWPYHALLGGIGHALVSSLEEAVFFHSIARKCQTDFELKGFNPLTENYSVIKPEVDHDSKGILLGSVNQKIINNLSLFDMTIIAGQAKSHCLRSTVEDILSAIIGKDKALVNRIYLLEDTTSSVVIPGFLDYTDEADAQFEKFKEAGMHLVRSEEPLKNWIH